MVRSYTETTPKTEVHTCLSCEHRRPVPTGYVWREGHAAAVKRQGVVAGGATMVVGDGSPRHSSQLERGGSRRVGGRCAPVQD